MDRDRCFKDALTVLKEGTQDKLIEKKNNLNNRIFDSQSQMQEI